MKKLITGNEAIAFGALSAGVKVISGYPGTPSSEVIGSLWGKEFPGTYVEWSTNEKVAFEVAAGAAIAGHRALCTMKMSGVNVAYDSLIGIAYSGCVGGLVVYVADDPGVTAGMCEQDTRDFAAMSDMVVLEPASVQEAYELTKFAFELSEAIGGPVFLRSVTNIAESHTVCEIEDRTLPKEGIPLTLKDVDKYTKAGAVLCMKQHRECIERLEKAGEIIEEKGLNKLSLKEKGGLGIISVGIVNEYEEEGFERLKELGIMTEGISTLKLAATLPIPVLKIRTLIDYCDKILVAEELEPHLEKAVYEEAYKKKADVEIFGKLNKTFERIGEYNSTHIVRGVCKALNIEPREEMITLAAKPESISAARPITFCAGCPHRGVYMGIKQALKNLKYRPEEVLITGDIGCTILGCNPPFNLLWTELSMGASIPLAQGFLYTGIDKPVLATIGDSTFFHGGIPGLINAIQHNINLTVVVLDNGWTAMTGMQVNPGTNLTAQVSGCRQLDLEAVIRGLGVDGLFVTDPYDQTDFIASIEKAITSNGVKVVLARRECAIQAARRKVPKKVVTIDPELCTSCKLCINTTGCPAISLHQSKAVIDPAQCNGCGLCIGLCAKKAIRSEA